MDRKLKLEWNTYSKFALTKIAKKRTTNLMHFLPERHAIWSGKMIWNNNLALIFCLSNNEKREWTVFELQNPLIFTVGHKLNMDKMRRNNGEARWNKLGAAVNDQCSKQTIKFVYAWVNKKRIGKKDCWSPKFWPLLRNAFCSNGKWTASALLAKNGNQFVIGF